MNKLTRSFLLTDAGAPKWTVELNDVIAVTIKENLGGRSNIYAKENGLEVSIELDAVCPETEGVRVGRSPRAKTTPELNMASLWSGFPYLITYSFLFIIHVTAFLKPLSESWGP